MISKIKRRQVDEPAPESSEHSSPSDHYYALKVIHKSIVNPAILAEMNNEIDLLKRLVSISSLHRQQRLISDNSCFAAPRDKGSPEHSQGVRNLRIEG